MHQASKEIIPALKRRTVFFIRGFQLRYTLLVAGSLLALLLFSGLHGIFMTQMTLPPDVMESFQPILWASTGRLFVAGIIFIAVVVLAAIFLSHRAVGPTMRLEEEIRRMAAASQPSHSLKVREGDEFETLVDAINLLLEKIRKH